MSKNKDLVQEFIYKYIVRLHTKNRTLLMDINDGLKNIDYDMYMYLFGNDVSAEEQLRREQYFIQLYQTPNFEQYYTYEETKYIAKFQSRDCIVYLYRALDGRIAVGDDRFHFNPYDTKYHLTREEIAETDDQFLRIMKPVNDFR